MKKIAMGIALVLAVQSTIAAPIYKSLDVVYNDIKLTVDGEEFILQDAYGTTIEPFVIDGMSYVPIEAMAAAFGRGILWDDATKTIHLVDGNVGEVVNLSDIPKTSFAGREAVYPIVGTVTDPTGAEHTSGLIFTGDGEGKSIVDIATYPLNGKYFMLSGVAFLPAALDIAGYVNSAPNSNVSGYTNLADIKIYGDGILLKEIPSLTRADVVNFEVNVSGVKELRIEIRAYGSAVFSNVVGLTNLLLYK